MFLFYLDASGTPQLSDATKHYVLVGAAVHENTWFALNKRVRGLKRSFAFPGEDFELHVKDFSININEQEKIPGFASLNVQDRRLNVERLRAERLRATRNPQESERLRRRYRLTRPFIHLTREERSKLYEDSLDLIGGHKGLVLFAEAIEKNHPAVVSGTVDCVRQAFEQVITRFDAFLSRNAAWKRLSNPRVRGDKGLIVMDRDLEKEKDIEMQFDDYRSQGHPWGRLEYVVDAPFLFQVIVSRASRSLMSAPTHSGGIWTEELWWEPTRRSSFGEFFTCLTEATATSMVCVITHRRELATALSVVIEAMANSDRPKL